MQDETSFKEFIRHRLLILGLAFRLAITPLFAHQYDFTVFTSTARSFYNYGVPTYFIKQSFPIFPEFTLWLYPALSYVLLIVSYFPVRLLPWDIAIFYESFTISEKFFIKLPFNLCDLATSYIILKIAEKNEMKKYASHLAFAYWLNPLSIFVASIYGTFDSVTVMLATLAFYHFTRERYALAAAEIVFGAAVKFQAILLILPFLIILWVKQRAKLVAFLTATLITYTIVIAIPSMIQYIPYFNVWTLNLSPSNLLSILEIPSGLLTTNPNMSYRNLLTRTELAPYIYYYNTLTTLILFTALFITLTYLTLKKNEKFVDVSSQVAYTVGTYMIFYASYGTIHQHYALWALPFLLLLLALGKIPRKILLIYNTIPIIHNFWRDSIFYFINEKYSPYGVGWGSFVATGTIFTIICLVILQTTVKDQLSNYRLFSKINDFFVKVPPERRYLTLYLTLTLTFMTIVDALNINGIYWASLPFIHLYPIEWGNRFLEWIPLPRNKELLLLYLAVTLMVPLPLVLTLPKQEGKNLKLAGEAKVAIPIILATLTLLIGTILYSTLTYVGLTKLTDYLYHEKIITTWWQAIIPLILLVFTRMPLGGLITLAHGGIIASTLIWIATVITLLTIIPTNQVKNGQNQTIAK